MPGISGIISHVPAETLLPVIKRMTASMANEPFHISGTLGFPGKCMMGWVSMKDSFSDCLPIWNKTKRICLILTGEVFADKSQLQILREKGYSVDSQKAEWLVNLYEVLGVNFVERLNGWFSGLLVDLEQSKVILFNDRYGLGRVYFHEREEAFYFSSEAKSLLAVLPELREIRKESLGELLSCGCVLQNRTLFNGTSLLPPGSVWTFSPGQPVQKKVYLKIEDVKLSPSLEEEEFYELLKETFVRILPQYLPDGEAVALSLTGGVDSRMVMAWAHREPGHLPCYTFGGPYRDCVDVRIARRVARACNQTHETISLDPTFFRDFTALAQKAVYLTDGNMDVSGAVELQVNRRAREIAPIRLTGNYGGEILRGLVAFSPKPVMESMFQDDVIPFIRDAAKTYANEAGDRDLSFVASKQVPWHHYGRFALEQSQLTLRSPFLDNELVSVIRRGPKGADASGKLSLRLIAEGNQALGRIPTDRGALHRPVPLVTKSRRIWQQFTFKAEYAFDYGMPQWLARLNHALSPLRLEQQLLGRHKFYHFRVWFRDQLASQVKDVLLDPKALSRPYLLKKQVEDIVHSHLQGNRNHTLAIQQLMTLEFLHRTLIDTTN